MSNWTHISASITEEEKEQLIKGIELYNKENDTEYNVNSFIRMIILNYIKETFDLKQVDIKLIVNKDKVDDLIKDLRDNKDIMVDKYIIK